MLDAWWFDVVTRCRQSSFYQWLLGVLLLLLTGLLLNAAARSQAHRLPTGTETANSCLQAAGADLKYGELMYRDMVSSSCGCKSGNVSR
jgi:hypothetical protein